MAAVTERSLAPEVNVVDIHDDVVWSRSGHLSVVYRIDAFHEPGLDGSDFDSAALLAENCWAGLPEGTLGFWYLPAVAVLSVATMLFAPLGVKAAHKLPPEKLKLAFGVLLLVIAARMLWGLLAA